MAEHRSVVEGWTVVEQMGHKKLGGYVREVTIAGKGFLRIDVYVDGSNVVATQFIHPDTIYALTPTTEGIARRLARSCVVEPVKRWELPAIETSPPASGPARDPSGLNTCRHCGQRFESCECPEDDGGVAFIDPEELEGLT